MLAASLLLLPSPAVGGRPIRAGNSPALGVVASGAIIERPAGAVEGSFVFFFFFPFLRCTLVLRCLELRLVLVLRRLDFFPDFRRRPRTLPPALVFFPGSIGSTKSIRLGMDTWPVSRSRLLIPREATEPRLILPRECCPREGGPETLQSDSVVLGRGSGSVVVVVVVDDDVVVVVVLFP